MRKLVVYGARSQEKWVNDKFEMNSRNDWKRKGVIDLLYKVDKSI